MTEIQVTPEQAPAPSATEVAARSLVNAMRGIPIDGIEGVTSGDTLQQTDLRNTMSQLHVLRLQALDRVTQNHGGAFLAALGPALAQTLEQRDPNARQFAMSKEYDEVQCDDKSYGLFIDAMTEASSVLPDLPDEAYEDIVEIVLELFPEKTYVKIGPDFTGQDKVYLRIHDREVLNKAA